MGEAPFRGAPFAGRGGFAGGFGGPVHNPTEYKQLFIGNVSGIGMWQRWRVLTGSSAAPLDCDMAGYEGSLPRSWQRCASRCFGLP